MTIRPSTRNRRHVLMVCLVLAAVLYRGLIPAGFMPASGEAARHGALFVVCPHGEMGMRMAGMHMDMPGHDGHGGGAPAGASLEQCPFGAAAGPALPSVKLAFSFPPVPAHARPDRTAVLNRAATPRLQPPARAPPILS